MKRMFTAAALFAAFGIAGVASAQQGGPTADLTPYNVTVRGGVAIPLDSRLTDVGRTLIDLGVEYQLNNSLLKTGETFFSLDYLATNLRFQHGSVIPFMINQRFYLSQPVGDDYRRNYWFIGAGVSFIDISSSDTAIGLRGGFGAELSEHVVAELAGYISDRASGVRANAVTISLGYRF